MNKSVLCSILITSVLLTSCGSNSNSYASSMEEAATSVEETTGVSIEETTTEETATTTTIYNEDKLDMSIDEVAEVLLNALGEGYHIFDEYDPNSESYIGVCEIDNESVGIVNCTSLGFINSLEEGFYDENEEYNSIIVSFEIYEFDMQSDEYKNLSVGSDFSCYSFVKYEFDSDWVSEETTRTAAAINKQYVIAVYAAYGKDYGFGTGFPAEDKPPYTIGNAQEGCDAFIELK